MGRTMLYGSFAALMALGGWFYVKKQVAPDSSQPVVLVLVATLLIGYAQKAIEDGDIARSRVRESDNPRLFRSLVFAHRIIAGILLALAGYLALA